MSARTAAWAMALLCAALAGPPAEAKESSMHPGALAHALDRLTVTGRVLYVAAHPDDENTRLLAYLANQRHLTVGYLSLTRGEGGQNLIGREQGELLGVIRTHELLAARALDGAVQRFTRARDQGYSKRADEALAQWGKEEVLSDVVWIIRRFQPDVIITRFDERPPNHGHHTASAILAREAAAAAADPARFPEQLGQGAQPWKVDRVLHNVSPWRDKPPPDALALDVGGYDARLGLSYGELAAVSRTQHKSQGFGVAPERGPLLEHFLPVAGTVPTRDLLEGLELGWGRFGPAAAPLADALEKARRSLARDAPERALPELLLAHRALGKLPLEPRTEDARAALERLLLDLCGLFARATSPSAQIAPGAKLPVKVELVLRRPAKVTLRALSLGGGAPEAVSVALGLNEKKELARELPVPPDAQVSTPYWLRTPAPDDPGHRAAPLGPPPLAVQVELLVGDVPLRLLLPIEHAWVDPVHGERLERVQVAPPATVTPTRQAILLPNGSAARLALRVRAHSPGVDGVVRLPLPPGWSITPAEQPVSLARPGDEATVWFDAKAPAGAAAVEARPELRVGDGAWSFREDVIDHPHLPRQLVLQPAAVRLVPLSIKLPKGLIGYVEGSGDSVREDLAHLGLRLEPIDDEALRAGPLGRYAAIVLGVRALNTRDAARAAHPRLMKYVEGGGTLVVQYNTNSRLAPLEGPVGPYPLTIGRDRITDERAALVAVDPKHPLLTTPNRLGPADFEGWVQERGLYFAEKWDPRYSPLFQIADPGEEPLQGGVLVARHGKGRFVYTGLSFFRQLPAGVPGAYRLLANLIGSK